MLRLLSAFVAAPFVAALFRNMASAGSSDLSALAFGSLIEAAYISVVALPLGLALFGLAWKFGKLQWYWSVAAGALIGVLFFAPVFWPTLVNEHLREWKKVEALSELVKVVLYCAGVALLTWVLGVWRNRALWQKIRKEENVAV